MGRHEPCAFSLKQIHGQFPVCAWQLGTSRLASSSTKTDTTLHARDRPVVKVTDARLGTFVRTGHPSAYGISHVIFLLPPASPLVLPLVLSTRSACSQTSVLHA
ncbi:hypothetical protein SprV_0401717700 [Sparganum proliferum]